MKDTVFIQANAKQLVGAMVSAYSLRRNSAHGDKFAVRIIRQEDYPFFAAREGQSFLRGGGRRAWRNDDLQSFTPLRFMPPELMGYQGRAVVIDPDVFAVGDIYELLSRDMQGKALFARPRPGHNRRPDYLASSVMLLDCAKLRHWRCEAQFDELFAGKRDYLKWIDLSYEPVETIGLLEDEWNHFDTLNAQTKLLHNTKRKTQPWKTGLPVDFTVREEKMGDKARQWIKQAKNILHGLPSRGFYEAHPDPRQERLFFGLLRECLDLGHISIDFLRDAMVRNHLRHDAIDLVEHPASFGVASVDSVVQAGPDRRLDIAQGVAQGIEAPGYRLRNGRASAIPQ